MKTLVVMTLASALLLFTGNTAGAQTARARIADTPIRVEATLASPIIATLKEGAPIEIVDVQGDWYRVLVPSDQGKPRVGYVLVHLIEILNADGSPKPIPVPPTSRAGRVLAQGPPIPPTLAQLQSQTAKATENEQPVRSGSDASQAELRTSRNDQPISQTGRPVPAPAGTISRPRTEWTPTPFKRGWLDVNFGMAMSAADASLFTFTSGLLSQASFYGKPPRGAEFDFGGGFMFTPVVGAGVSLSGAAHQDIAGLGAGIGNLTLASGSTGVLSRTEGAVNLQAMVVPVNSERFRVRVFGGPSLFSYQADMVRDFSFARSQVTALDVVKTDGTGLGFHVGGDATFFFSKVVGIGAFARYGRATASIDEPMSDRKQDITLGGFQTGGGLRFRF